MQLQIILLNNNVNITDIFNIHKNVCVYMIRLGKWTASKKLPNILMDNVGSHEVIVKKVWQGHVLILCCHPASKALQV